MSSVTALQDTVFPKQCGHHQQAPSRCRFGFPSLQTYQINGPRTINEDPTKDNSSAPQSILLLMTNRAPQSNDVLNSSASWICLPVLCDVSALSHAKVNFGWNWTPGANTTIENKLRCWGFPTFYLHIFLNEIGALIKWSFKSLLGIPKTWSVFEITLFKISVTQMHSRHLLSRRSDRNWRMRK